MSGDLADAANLFDSQVDETISTNEVNSTDVMRRIQITMDEKVKSMGKLRTFKLWNQ